MLNAARFSRVSLLAASTAAALVALAVTACDESLDAECCLAEPVCPEGAQEVDACVTSECFSVEACCTEKLCEPMATCEAAPSCPLGQTEVPTCDGSTAFDCKPVSLCGSTIFCETPPPCEALPSCDEGDDEQPSGVCPDNAPCYIVEVCGTSILCSDNGLAHGCPEVPPVQGEPCSFPVVCQYPVEVDCFEVWECGELALQGAPVPVQALEWQPGGTVCADPPN